jgi:hypothetical protein
VSSVKELVRRWYPAVQIPKETTQSSHRCASAVHTLRLAHPCCRALDDIRGSIRGARRACLAYGDVVLTDGVGRAEVVQGECVRPSDAGAAACACTAGGGGGRVMYVRVRNAGSFWDYVRVDGRKPELAQLALYY